MRATVLPCLLFAAAPALAQTPAQSALRPTGIQAEHIGWLWNLTLGICTLVFLAVVAACLVALRRAPKDGAGHTPDLDSLVRPERRIHRTIGWAVGVCTVLLLVLLAADVFTSRALARMPLKNAVNIELVGHQWWWEARYQFADTSLNFSTANELHIPVGRPVVISLRSIDVIHSLWIPNLHGKRDLIPGRTALLRLRADRAGVYRGQCAEFCGLQHAKMALEVMAEPPAQYEAWAARQRQPAHEPADQLSLRGRAVFEDGTCIMCHTVNGTIAQGKLGPDLTHLGSRRTIAAGMFPNNRGFLSGWIADPHSMKEGVNMPANALAPDDLQALAAYLESLK
ncbi:cytochrome c oxidase subunit II [Massilia sp. 9I]|uniref:cytochrome c oxidase subunit II n=1 Tax=Massilia sp. 9I TaxID=2653152 RepID=UPI0012F45949|nr:cytochrome c oxidase subunit II [Massilia sp. 9I]VXB95151.1 Cytochrome c oxidase polypeptide II [Massilia sp. 9I]